MKRSDDEKAALVNHLKELHLPTIRSCFEELARQAEQETSSYERYLLGLIERELQVRRQHRLERQLRDSRLPMDKDLTRFDMKRLPAKLARQVKSLLDGSFVDRRENLLAFGTVGSGKTHLLCGIAHELVRQGRKVYFRSCGLLVQELLAAKRDLKLSRVIKKLARYEAIVIDDLGYVQQSREEMEVLFTGSTGARFPIFNLQMVTAISTSSMWKNLRRRWNASSRWSRNAFRNALALTPSAKFRC